MSEESVKVKFDEVCSELNLDVESKETAWSSYKRIYNDYVLEGSQIEWLACALYVACRSTSTQTVDGGQYSGNSISLTQILRVTNLRLIEFFRKVKKWLDMAKLPPVYLEKVETLERKFEVISVIFKKYKMEFSTIFQLQDSQTSTPISNGSSSSRPRNRKPNKSKPCTSTQLFQFGWILYIHIKNQFPLISDDLVNSHYLLLCCLDMLCSAVLYGKRKDLLSTEMAPLFESPSFSPLDGVLPELCRQFAAIEKECLVVKDYYWWPSVRRLFEAQKLVGVTSKSPDLMEVINCLIQSSYFQTNYRSLKSLYELSILEEGDFDERLFLNGPLEFETPPTGHTSSSGSSEKEKLQPGVIYQSPQHLQYGTPFTGREYLTSRENKLTPVSDANQSVIQLHLLLEDCHPKPSDTILNTCSCCSVDPLKSIQTRLDEMSKLFLAAFKADSFVSPDNFALLRLQLTQSLYYKLLTAIIIDEEKKHTQSLINTPNKYTSIQLMLEHDHFHKSLFALSAEMVLFSYSSHTRIFPWILSVIDIDCYHFYKVIEVIIKVEPGFPRAVVKHLSKIEELILTSLAWTSSSPLFTTISTVGSVPRYEEVALPSSSLMMTTPSLMSPRNSRQRMSKDSSNSSPLSARDRYSSPNPASSRRQLFTARKGGVVNSPLKSPLVKQHPPLAPKPPQGVVQVTQLKNSRIDAVAVLSSLLQRQAASPQRPTPPLVPPTSSPSHDPTNLTIQALVSMANMKSPLVTTPEKTTPLPTITLTVSPSQAKTPSKVTTPTSVTTPTPRECPRKTGSLALFFRKVYQMSYLRIKDLCERLQLEGDVVQKVWTCFEYCIVHSPDLMRDRNIDQFIMCSLYIVAKVLRKEVTFQEIMRQYRHQPQAKSHVYRSVLLNNGPPKCVLINGKTTPTKDSPMETTPTNTTPTNKDTSINNEDTPTKTTPTNSDDIPTKTTPTNNEDMPTEGILTDSEQTIQNDFENDSERIKNQSTTKGVDKGVESKEDTPPVDSRGDIIQFYNKVFIDQVKDFVLKFSTPHDENNDLLLSPLPVIKRTPMSPRKLSKAHQIFISPLKGNQSCLSPLAKTYVVSKSPASDFQELNHVIGMSNRTHCKRKLDILLCNSPGLNSPAKRMHLERTSRHQPVAPTDLHLHKTHLSSSSSLHHTNTTNTCNTTSNRLKGVNGTT